MIMKSLLRAATRRSVLVTLLPVLALVPLGAAVHGQEGLTPVQVSQIETVTSVAISPDGRHIAYTRSVPANAFARNVTPTTQLHVYDRSTGESRALHTTSSVASVAFRPGHGTVTFLAAVDQASVRGVHEVDVAGGTPRRVLTFERPIQSYAWSPDGTLLAFTANEAVEAPSTPLPYRPDFYEENVPQRRGYVADVAAAGAPRAIEHIGSYYDLVWSPAGDRLAVAVAPTPMIDDFYMQQSVKVVDAATLRVVADIENEGKLGGIAWSPDGRNLALRAGHDIHDPIDGRILVVSATGGTPRNILPDFEGKFEQIEWTGADEIHFLASEGVRSVFGKIRPDGSRLERLAGEDDVALTRFALSRDGHAALIASTPRHPAELYVLEARQRQPQRLTDSNPWLADEPLGEQRVVRYTARDGAFEIEGLLILPVGHTPGTRVPLITVVHGGPEAHYLNGWLTGYNLPGQMAAAGGYAVFYSNYRGSTGRGLTFARSSQGDAGGREFDDIVDGVDHLIELGIVDGDRVGVTGGSYGGYATAWMSTYYSDRFAAGVMNVGISNNLSKWGTSDIPNELYLVHSLERLWDNQWQKYLERSPIYHVDRAETPLLIMHGAEDTRVHPGQSLELYRHMVVRRPEVPVRLIFYPGEGHGNTRSASRLDYTMRMIQWFDAFLQGDGEKPSRDLGHGAPFAVGTPAEVGTPAAAGGAH
jgi:dipeptidyl aminopeptidase/acylaminoacyl peptidase